MWENFSLSRSNHCECGMSTKKERECRCKRLCWQKSCEESRPRLNESAFVNFITPSDLLHTSDCLINSRRLIDESSRKSESLIDAIIIPCIENWALQVHVAKDNSIVGDDFFKRSCSLINSVLKKWPWLLFPKKSAAVENLPAQRPFEVGLKGNFAKGLRVCSLWWRCHFLLISIAFGEDRCLRFFFRGKGLGEWTRTRLYFRALFAHCDAAPQKVS